MTVAELIKELQKYPATSEIVGYEDHFESEVSVDGISQEGGTVYIHVWQM